jgi:putative transposase
MPRTARVAPGGLVYHVLNRAVGKMPLWGKEPDLEAFERVMIEAFERHPLRILSYCVLSNHWHFVVWPEHDGEVTAFFRWLTHTHAMRWRVAHRTVGYGPLYQGRFKSFPVQSDEHLLTVARYVERNPVAAGLVPRAEEWRWGSLWTRTHGDDAVKRLLSPWPFARPKNWITRVNAPLSGKELKRIQVSLERGRPWGDEKWVDGKVAELGLKHTVRPEGRPPKAGISNRATPDETKK